MGGQEEGGGPAHVRGRRGVRSQRGAGRRRLGGGLTRSGSYLFWSRFLRTMRYTSSRMVSKARSTLVLSEAELAARRRGEGGREGVRPGCATRSKERRRRQGRKGEEGRGWRRGGARLAARAAEAGARLNESEVVVLGKVLCVVDVDALVVALVALVAHEHRHDGRVRVRAQLSQPPLAVLERLALRDVVHEKRAQGAAVEGGGDRLISLLPRRVPHLHRRARAGDPSALRPAGRECAEGRWRERACASIV